MTVYTGSTSDALAQLSQLNQIASATPTYSVGVVNDIWEDIKNELAKLVKPIVDGVTQGINNLIQGVKDFINDKISPIVNNVVTGVTNIINSVSSGISDAINGLVNGIKSAINSIGDWINGAIDSIRSAIDSVGNWIRTTVNSISDWVVNAVNTAVDAVASWIGGVVASVGEWLSDTYNRIKDSVVNAVNNIGQWVTDTYNNIKAAIERVVQTLVNAYEAAKKTVEDKIQDIINWAIGVKDSIVKWWWQTLTNIGAWFAREVMPRWATVVKGAQDLIGIGKVVWEAVGSGDYQKAFDVIDQLFHGIGLPAPMASLNGIVSAIAYFWETVHLKFVPMEVAAQKQAVISLGLDPISLDAAAAAYFKGAMSEAEYLKNAALGGVAASRAKGQLEASRALPTPGQVQDAFLRGEINLQEHDRLLSSYGFTKDNIDLIKALYLLIPGPSDLIRMAVREAFTPDIAEKFGQYQDFPQAFGDWGAKIGLSKDWASRYWAAHWDLPSATMGFEMLHRGVISNEELTLLLRALDVMPYWRERLIKISYNPLTRVDVRRMYAAGVIDKGQVTRAYLDLGYDQQKAEWLTDFTVRYYSPEDQTQQDEFKTMARATYSQAFRKHIISEDEYRTFLEGLKYYKDDIDLLVQLDSYSMVQDDKLFDPKGWRQDYLKLVLQAYDRGLLHENEVRPMLIDLGYDDNEASLELSLSDYNRSLKLRNLVVEAVHDQYTTYIIDNVGMYTLLDQFNFTSEEIAKLQEEWDLERVLRTKRPSLSDLRRFYEAGLLSREQYLDELRGQGYHEKYIPMYDTLLAKK